jgi:SAM-dependent methyltransferase
MRRPDIMLEVNEKRSVQIGKSAVRERYRGESGRLYHARVHSSSAKVTEAVARQRARKLQPFVATNDSVLEYGAGTGLNLRYLQCRRRIAFDPSEAGRQACETAGIEFFTDASAIPTDVSLVICHHVLEHVPDPFDSLEQMYGLLPEGGALIVCVPFETHRSFREYRLNDPNHHLFSWNALTLGNLVSSVGFEVCDVTVRPFGYEQRLAFLSQYGSWAYRAGLAAIRTIRPADEVFLRGLKPCLQCEFDR